MRASRSRRSRSSTAPRLRHNGDHEEVDTLGGLVFTLAGRVPRRGEVIPHPGGHRIRGARRRSAPDQAAAGARPARGHRRRGNGRRQCLKPRRLRVQPGARTGDAAVPHRAGIGGARAAGGATVTAFALGALLAAGAAAGRSDAGDLHRLPALSVARRRQRRRRGPRPGSAMSSGSAFSSPASTGSPRRCSSTSPGSGGRLPFAVLGLPAVLAALSSRPRSTPPAWRGSGWA